MPIQNVVVNAVDVQRSVDFYTRFLDAEVVGEADLGRAVLDLVTATFELRQAAATERAPGCQTTCRKASDTSVSRSTEVDPRAEVLRRAGTRFHLDPLDAEGGVRICFFFDPDGTLLELVEGDLQYASVLDPEGVALERALGVPSRPRFDHIAVTVETGRPPTPSTGNASASASSARSNSHTMTAGFSIGYLKSGDTVIEVFTYQTAKQDRGRSSTHPASPTRTSDLARSTACPRFRAGATPAVFVDPDGFPFTAVEHRAAGMTVTVERRLDAPARIHWPAGPCSLCRRRAAGQHAGELRIRGELRRWRRPGRPHPRQPDSDARHRQRIQRWGERAADRSRDSSLRWIARRTFVVATKVDARNGDYSGERVRASVAESKERLGLDFLPLVYLHDPEYFDFAEMSKPGGAVETLIALRAEGQIGHVGLAGGTVQEMSRYLALGGFEVVLVHNRWTLVDRSAADLISAGGGPGRRRGERRDLWRRHPGQPGRRQHQLRLPSSYRQHVDRNRQNGGGLSRARHRPGYRRVAGLGQRLPRQHHRHRLQQAEPAGPHPDRAEC